ncbi:MULTISPECIES: TraE/TraK family type IV conjugative transfer system protein [Acinetobacter]|uniref:TraE/TraK family type IV conjugative transfer system protein n=1 Tax=Acinetobacter TaxID=469 RepID=UPI000742F298|nr:MULTISPECIES: TraE/TraK family type IV conjugative transfer system protein [Acinetobacter]ALY01409.1 Type IV conjugative transfer system protein TraE [Acinetobacter baumannii]EKT9248070.1 conjugal transfer protein TraE [Acinetobacter baumannii]EKV8039665.1 conjugal transfer protein TraE [Acinetobacter baumannii]MBE2308821.1 conjugal transfer protein TraE [Acinetobacter baumannii]MBE2623431.1 conjugal transfer protein TraE [Acinetobacter baumannii]
MRRQNGEKTIGELSADRRASRLFSLIMSVSNIGLIGILGYVLMNQTVIIMPSQQSAQYSIGNDQANKEYFIDITRDNLNLLYNVTPINVDENFGKLLEGVLPEHQKDMKNYLDKAAEQIKRDQVTQVWSTTGMYEFFPSEKAVIATGVTKTYLADKLVTSKTQNIRFDYVMKNGRLYPRNIMEVKQDETQ